MIVTCTSCQTRFRVSREQIGPKGARIRCGRCHAVFVIPPAAHEGVSAAPLAAAPVGPQAPSPPPLPRAGERATAPGSEVPAGDPFAPGPPAQAAASLDPFAPVTRATAPRGAPTFAPDPFAPADEGADPFGPVDGGATPAGEDEPGTLDDPFGPGLLSDPPRGTSAAVPLAATDLTELLDGSARRSPGVASDSLALEERESPPLAGGGASFEQPEMHVGPAGLDLVGSEVAGRGGDDGASGYGEVPGLDGWDPDPGEPELRGLEANAGPNGGAVPVPAVPVPAVPVPWSADETPPSAGLAAPEPPMPSVAPAPVPAPASSGSAPFAAAAGGGPLVAALTSSLSLALLIAVAIALFLAWRGGLPARLLGSLSRAPAPLVETLAVRGGLYDTATGSAVLVVRGQVGARAPVSGPVRVRAELVDGGRVVATASGLAGATATSEQVFGVGAPEEVAALRRELDARAVTSLAAGATVPFLVVFPPPAPDPSGLELRVAAEPTPAATR